LTATPRALVEHKPLAPRLVLEEPVCDDVAPDRGERAIQIERRYRAAAPQVLG
jgi:hypothetical protein